MANLKKRVAEDTPGDFFVDSTCIDCDTCRQVAPAVFAEGRGHAFVHRQPIAAEERHHAFQALVCCPTGSIGCQHKSAADGPKAAMDDFPLSIEEPVYYCGFNSPKSFGGNSYFIRHPDGNWLIDSPKFLPRLVRRFEALGGIAHIFLTHSDDVADARLYARHFGSTRHIHRAELDSQPDAEAGFDGDDPIRLATEFLAIPTPGHTAGHCVLLFRDRFLFTGDHLAWDRSNRRLEAYQDYCWYSWPRQVESMRRLAGFSFEWALPGHGQRVQLASNEMRKHMQQLVIQMQATLAK
jgi:glyoxylase-like metal-dependent hydrolase (beta-lactamase superfamily II)/ferredoxin